VAARARSAKSKPLAAGFHLSLEVCKKRVQIGKSISTYSRDFKNNSCFGSGQARILIRYSLSRQHALGQHTLHRCGSRALHVFQDMTVDHQSKRHIAVTEQVGY
jgi:hypothetical protein